MNVFPAVVNGTKFQEQQKTFVIHFFDVIQHTLIEHLLCGPTRCSCWHVEYEGPVQDLIYRGEPSS